ncbi:MULTISPECIES: hypothetical protein [Streptomyces]|uniref:ATPase subunit gpP of terminase n=1 Tax=[Kitasatospora] papulosa TaxID=1464011 RepID=A0ABZ1K2Y5_9ACTN|nr:hypothetical protein [Streptomyces sp. P9-2B-1]WJY31991.1 hypothetical protein QTO28_13675 [Streptomyces sp. P9-2B-1]
MTHANGKYADFEGLREKAVALRREGLSRRQIRDRLHVDNNDILHRLLEGEPAPEWTKRPRARDDLRAKARELRLQGMTYDQIQVELGCSKSSISLWVRDLPKPERSRSAIEQARLAGRMRWDHELAVRDTERQQTKSTAKAEIGDLTDRELLLVGAGLYWAEGTKDKPYDRRENLTFVNSDPGMIETYLAWLALVGVTRDRIRFRVMIHRTADVAAAERYWAELVGVDASALQRTTLKKHNPRTARKNTGESYHGCLVIRVSQGAELYRRVEGWWCGIVEQAQLHLR